MDNPRIILNLPAIYKIQNEQNLSDTQMSQKIGINKSTFWRLKTGGEPNAQNIAKFLTAFQDKKFEDLFSVA